MKKILRWLAGELGSFIVWTRICELPRKLLDYSMDYKPYKRNRGKNE